MRRPSDPGGGSQGGARSGAHEILHQIDGGRPLTTPRAPTLVRLVAHVLLHPRMAYLLLRAAWRFRARDWYRRPPFLPLPPAEYLDWRMHTAYGDGGTEPTAAELRGYLEWTLRMRRRVRSIPG